MIDETKLKKLLLEVVTDLSYTVTSSHYTDQVFESLKAKIDKANLTDTGADAFELFGEDKK